MKQGNLAPVLEAELKRIAAIRDPEERAYAATQLIEILQQNVVSTAEIRSESLRALRADGWSLGQISRVFGITRARVAQLTVDRLVPPSTDGHHGG
ncbi:MAG: hypothetical protein ACOYNI_01950 [Acidimicrobiia bacterium]